ncbi:hypothetical protein HK107_13455 [Parvularcula sp. ZS-1/3]|uniref:Uncharacterized protein n=1 Tax=Parvularcula mediterranea TaxID=2732508 RepID=A0A7Y3W6G9_9PROT|nr:hypothetical protein [Parvularcula mediterranea]NNU17332.1 hypothetical protein [Parvularcula mediterranea]
MIALLLLTTADPVLARLQEAPYTEGPRCPFTVDMVFASGEENESTRLLIDPADGKAVVIDEDGNPVEGPEGDEQSTEEPEPRDEGEDDGQSVSMGAIKYEELRSLFALPFERTGEADGLVTFTLNDLPNGTVELAEKDLSNRSQIELTVAEGGDMPYLAAYRETLLKPVRMKVVARIKAYEREASFELFEGAPRTVSEAMKASISIMGKPQEMAFNMTYDYPDCPEEEVAR